MSCRTQLMNIKLIKVAYCNVQHIQFYTCGIHCCALHLLLYDVNHWGSLLHEGHPPVLALGEVQLGKRHHHLAEELVAPKVVIPHTQTQCSLLQPTARDFVLQRETCGTGQQHSSKHGTHTRTHTRARTHAHTQPLAVKSSLKH